MLKCPKCGHAFKAENQVKGGKARWRGMNKSKRTQAARAAAIARWANVRMSDGGRETLK